ETHGIDDLGLQLDIDPTNGVPVLLGISNQPPSSVVVFGSGSGNLALEASTNLLGWFFRASLVPDGNGRFAYADSTAGFAQKSYRLKAVNPLLPTNLIAYWRAENNYLDSFDGNHGNAFGTAPTFVPGQRGTAWSFNGTNSGLSTPGTV